MSHMRVTWLASCLLAGGWASLAAQTVDSAPEAGEILIRYEIRGEAFTARIPTSDRIAPRVDATISEQAGGIHLYRWSIANRDTLPAIRGRGIRSLQIPCTLVGGFGTAAIGGSEGWVLDVMQGSGGETTCVYRARPGFALDPGRVATVLVRSTALPGIARFSARGVAGLGSIPTGEDTPDSVRVLIGWAEGQGVHFFGVAPVRDPASLSTSSIAVARLREDLRTACGELEWIAPAGLCESLAAKLGAVGASLTRGRTTTAAHQLEAFRSELEAQRGKGVADNAYSLLSVIADHALSLMQ